MTATRDRVHKLVDALPENEPPEIETFLAERRLQAYPIWRALYGCA